MVGCGFPTDEETTWPSRGTILEVAEQHEDVAVEDEVDGETDSQVRAWYLRDPREEGSDPELLQRLRHAEEEDSDSDASMESTSQPHDPYAATVIEDIDRDQGAFGNLAICNWLLERCARRLREAYDRSQRLFYTDVLHSLRDSFTKMCTGEMEMTQDRLRNILREFARFSPRSDSPTSCFTVQQVYEELMAHERNQGGLDEMEVDPMQEDEGDQAMDNAGPMVFEGPLTLEQSINCFGINSTRRRMINDIHERLAEAEAYSNWTDLGVGTATWLVDQHFLASTVDDWSKTGMRVASTMVALNEVFNVYA